MIFYARFAADIVPAFMLGMQVQYQPQILHIRTEKHTVEFKTAKSFLAQRGYLGVPLSVGDLGENGIEK